MSDAEPALLRAHPDLRERLPHHSFLPVSTPVEPFHPGGVGADALWIKRDERSCPLYGGNKPRKLEWTLAEASAKRSRRIVTSGGLGTNHGLATTILAGSLGMATTVVLVDQPRTPAVKRQLLRMAAWGADLVYGRNVAGAAWHTSRVVARSLAAGERPFTLLPGGSSTRGNLGFVSAGLELGEQVRAGAVPEPHTLFIAVGSGGSLAGLCLGLRLAGLATRLVGVVVTDILPPSGAALARRARSTLRLLQRHDASVPDLPVDADDFELTEAQLGPGYGAATPASEAAVAAAGAAGVELETTYTGKCLAEILARAARDELGPGPVLFWNTYNAVDVDDTPVPMDMKLLPAPLARLFEPET